MPRRSRLVLGVLAALATLPLLAAPASAGGLRAGAGRADITPPTGYYMFGWVRSDARSHGQLTRLFSRAIVLERGEKKVALVSADMGAIPAGLVADAAQRAGHGFSARNVVISASHTHSAPTGYFNYGAFNTVAPTDTTPNQFAVGKPANPVLYTFLSRQLAKAIRRADHDVGPAKAGWGSTRLLHVTENRSLEAHLADHGINVGFGQGKVSMDPRGYVHTIDPGVAVLRVDKVEHGRDVPIGAWSTFADHGTVVKPTFTYYNADHHAAAARLAERRIRRLGHVPAGQEVVNSYGNSDEGDITAGIQHSGPAGAYEVGRDEARAMVSAWRTAGGSLDRRPPLGLRWTRVCFCGQQTAAGPVASSAVVGLPFLTGSEENRGPLFDETHIPFEGYHLPASSGPQGDKIQTIRDPGGQFPTAVPLSAVRVGDGAIVTIPGEMSEGMGRRLRAAALHAAAGSGIRRIVVSGLANDFIQYMTTPEEYGRQHYEGGTSLFGPAEGVFIQERLANLVHRLVAGQPAPPPDPFDPRNGVADDAPRYPRGADDGQVLTQPRTARRLGHPSFRWAGGLRGLDRPLERPFITVQRRGRHGGWHHADDDLGLRILWTVRGHGNYRARWEPPLGAVTGRYRFLVTANRYHLHSKEFRLRPARDLKAGLVRSGGGRAVLELRYPVPVENLDLTWRPARAEIDSAKFKGGGRNAEVRLRGHRAVVTGRPGAVVRVATLRDPHGNRSHNRLRFEL
jgi:neutral ceramidase